MVCYLVCNNTADLHQNISAKVEEVSEARPVLLDSTHSTCLPQNTTFRENRPSDNTHKQEEKRSIEIFETTHRVRETEPRKPVLACDRILLRANAISIR